ncbi:hypothetical protein GLAREA_05161 [Glarea lozoyensis ATCC 20868]|uniref:Uncharacterized protein n=1 Tax=Glarea lozoyensis (strain ATCC 20868 / MF5171) TaxID=1116229 RepID=S3EC10_GLAL2|nr:uncharacterized protein GLAREA_05161 [Glarea lozoyensis ATCC 20868]EPE35823.1 hypothetical protein GLAREA_05161 [Glarea lozoyensis ATCC 20868]
MITSSKIGRLLALLVAFLALSPCWASPAPSHNHDLVLAHSKDSGGKGKDKRTRPTTPDNKPGGGGGSPPNAPGRENTVTRFSLTKTLSKWLDSKKEILPYMVDQKGGIEGWVQAEFAAYVRKGLGSQDSTTISREIAVYAGREHALKQADFVFIPKSGNADRAQGLIVELKVQSSSNSPNSFKELVNKDLKRMELDMQSKYAQYDRAVVAIAWDPEILKTMDKFKLPKIHSVPLEDASETTVTIYASEEGKKEPAEDNPPPPPFGPGGGGGGGGGSDGEGGGESGGEEGSGSRGDLPLRPKTPPKDPKGKGKGAETEKEKEAEKEVEKETGKETEKKTEKEAETGTGSGNPKGKKKKGKKGKGRGKAIGSS